MIPKVGNSDYHNLESNDINIYIDAVTSFIYPRPTLPIDFNYNSFTHTVFDVLSQGSINSRLTDELIAKQKSSYTKAYEFYENFDSAILPIKNEVTALFSFGICEDEHTSNTPSTINITFNDSNGLL